LKGAKNSIEVSETIKPRQAVLKINLRLTGPYVFGTLHEAILPIIETFSRFSAYCPGEALGNGNRIHPY
jgi:hypothetical protein